MLIKTSDFLNIIIINLIYYILIIMYQIIRITIHPSFALTNRNKTHKSGSLPLRLPSRNDRINLQSL